MSSHPITGVTTCMVAGERRELRFDMNCAAALHESKGEHWNNWLVARFLGEEDGQDGRKVTPVTPYDTITVLHALLATDREDRGLQETEASLRRTLAPGDVPHLQLAMLRVVLAGFGLPGEAVEAVVGAADQPPARHARAEAGTGPGPLRSPMVRSGSRPTGSGARR